MFPSNIFMRARRRSHEPSEPYRHSKSSSTKFQRFSYPRMSSDAASESSSSTSTNNNRQTCHRRLFDSFISTFFGCVPFGQKLSESLVYRPTYPVESRVEVLTPAEYHLPFEAVLIETKDNVLLHAYVIKQMNEDGASCAPVLLFFHGNAGNIGHRLQNVAMLFQEVRCNIVIVEYRGYGLSQGTPSEQGLYNDSEATLRFILNRKDLNSKAIVIFGRSLGGGVAIDLASKPEYRDNIAALIVENTFTSIPDLAKTILPWPIVRWMPKCLYKSKYQNYDKISSITCPTLFLCGLEDTVVPPQMMQDLYLKCASRFKWIKTFSCGSHNDTWMCPGYSPAILQFLYKVFDDLIYKSDPTISNSICE